MSKDGLFSRCFLIISKSGVPIVGLLVSSILRSILLIKYSNNAFINQFAFIGKLTVFFNINSLFLYLFNKYNFNV